MPLPQSSLLSTVFNLSTVFYFFKASLQVAEQYQLNGCHLQLSTNELELINCKTSLYSRPVYQTSTIQYLLNSPPLIPVFYLSTVYYWNTVHYFWKYGLLLEAKQKQGNIALIDIKCGESQHNVCQEAVWDVVQEEDKRGGNHQHLRMAIALLIRIAQADVHVCNGLTAS